ncbi:MAG: hypothetical protein HWQ37_29415 [Nostoc sp. NMS4]|nr:hypothetical protein [Nostoc sp. NMS4]
MTRKHYNNYKKSPFLGCEKPYNLILVNIFQTINGRVLTELPTSLEI